MRQLTSNNQSLIGSTLIQHTTVVKLTWDEIDTFYFMDQDLEGLVSHNKYTDLLSIDGLNYSKQENALSNVDSVSMSIFDSTNKIKINLRSKNIEGSKVEVYLNFSGVLDLVKVFDGFVLGPVTFQNKQLSFSAQSSITTEVAGYKVLQTSDEVPNGTSVGNLFPLLYGTVLKSAALPLSATITGATGITTSDDLDYVYESVGVPVDNSVDADGELVTPANFNSIDPATTQITLTGTGIEDFIPNEAATHVLLTTITNPHSGNIQINGEKTPIKGGTVTFESSGPWTINTVSRDTSDKYTITTTSAVNSDEVIGTDVVLEKVYDTRSEDLVIELAYSGGDYGIWLKGYLFEPIENNVEFFILERDISKYDTFDVESGVSATQFKIPAGKNIDKQVITVNGPDLVDKQGIVSSQSGQTVTLEKSFQANKFKTASLSIKLQRKSMRSNDWISVLPYPSHMDKRNQPVYVYYEDTVDDDPPLAERTVSVTGLESATATVTYTTLDVYRSDQHSSAYHRWTYWHQEHQKWRYTRYRSYNSVISAVDVAHYFVDTNDRYITITNPDTSTEDIHLDGTSPYVEFDATPTNYLKHDGPFNDGPNPGTKQYTIYVPTRAKEVVDVEVDEDYKITYVGTNPRNAADYPDEKIAFPEYGMRTTTHTHTDLNSSTAVRLYKDDPDVAPDYFVADSRPDLLIRGVHANKVSQTDGTTDTVLMPFDNYEIVRDLPITVNNGIKINPTLIKFDPPITGGTRRGEGWLPEVFVDAESPHGTIRGAIQDTEQGTLALNTTNITDSTQDFTDYDATGDEADYFIIVTNDDGTKEWGFIGVNTTTQCNVFTLKDIATAGWQGDVTGKTPSSYVIYAVSAVGNAEQVFTDFVDEFLSEYTITVESGIESTLTAYPTNFTLSEEMQSLDFLRTLAYESGLAVVIRGTEISVTDPDIDTEDTYLDPSSIVLKSDSISTVVSETTYGKVIGAWFSTYLSELSRSGFIVDTTDLNVLEVEFKTITNEISAVRSIALIGNRLAKETKLVTFTTTLSNLQLDMFDIISLEYPELSLTAINCMVHGLSYNFEEGTISITLWVPVQ